MTTFSPDILQNPTTLARFLSGKEEAAAVVQAGHSTLAGRWVVTEPSCWQEMYLSLSSLVLMIASYALQTLCMTDLSKRAWVLSRHQSAQMRVLETQKIFQNNVISRSINTHQIDTADFYLQHPLSTNLPRTEAARIPFFYSWGICHGMCHWFIHLFFKTYGHFPNAEQHLCALSTQFEQGAPRQAAFLQAPEVFSSIADLLKLDVQKDYKLIDPRVSTHEQIIRGIQSCEPGVYGIYAGNHQVAYIKYADKQFLFDPNRGVIKVDSPDLFLKAMESYLKVQDHGLDILIDRYLPRHL